jgi:molybdopterin molybdotransferase
MITYKEAYNIVISSARLLEKETVCLPDAVGRILANDIIADMDMPPFDKSAMDGYACRREDIFLPLQVTEVIPAGSFPTIKIEKGLCAKIMTGAMLPEGADCVLMVEQTKIIDENKIQFTGTTTTNNISYKAEDIKKGNVVLEKGLMLQPQHVAILASVGVPDPSVYRQPRVAIISTGDELVEPDAIPNPTQIRNSNAWQLIAQVKKAGAIPVYSGIAKDSPQETERMIQKAITENDVLLLTGGVSMGDFDFVPEVLKNNNISLKFEKLHVKPGRPTVFGFNDSCFVFGLPGNPVSAYITFETLTKPLLYKMMGYDYKPLQIMLPLASAYTRRKPDRLEWIPVKINQSGEAEFIEYHGSAHVHSLCFADGIIAVSEDTIEIKKGEKVHVRLL